MGAGAPRSWGYCCQDNIGLKLFRARPVEAAAQRGMTPQSRSDALRCGRVFEGTLGGATERCLSELGRAQLALAG